MSDTIIDAAIASVPVSTEQTVPESKVEDQPATTESESSAESEPQEPQKQQEDDVPFPKKAVNAISRRDRQIGKMRAELAALRAEMQKFQAPQEQKQFNSQDKAPSEDQFENYGDYLEAKIGHKLRQEQAEFARKQQEQQAMEQRALWANQREEAISTKASEYVSQISDFQSVIAENADLADEFPQHVQDAFYEADDAPLAFYNLAKEGKLEALASMSPQRVAMEIAKAQFAKPVQQKVSNAPKPITSIKGTGGGGKSINNMSWEEQKAWLKS